MNGRKKTAIVTGGGRGIGLAVTKALADAGYNVCVTGQSPYSRYADALDEMGDKVMYVQGDISSDSDRHELVKQAFDAFGRVDVLVNNAGIAPRVRADILEMTEQSFDEVIGVNLKGTMLLTQAVAREMIKQQPIDGTRGVIVNISSFSSHVSSVNRAEYCVSKAGISMLTKLYADRLAGEGIRVYEIQPGVIKTDMTEKVSAKYDALIEAGLFPIRRWGYPEDVARAVIVLTDGGLTYTTGQVLHVDGGFTDVRSL